MSDAVVVVDETEDPINLPTWLMDTGERLLVTVLFALVSVFGVDFASDGFNLELADKMATTALIAAATFLSTAALPKRGFGLSPLVDVVARIVWSFLQGASAVLAADAYFQWYDTTRWQPVVVGGVMAALSALKAAIALRQSTTTITPASLAPARTRTTQPPLAA